MKDHYFIFAGERSGDLHGGGLVEALKKMNPSLQITGVGGPIMRAHGVECILPMENFQVMGFTDVIKSLPTLWKQFCIVRDAILTTRPSCVILIDYPGFNLRLAKSLRKNKFEGKIVQYICPTVWAHGKKRIQTMAQTLDLLLTIFPFEATHFSHTSLPVKFVGNSLVESVNKHSYDLLWKSKTGVPEGAPLIGIFPGSREAEIRRNLPNQLKACALLKERHPEIIFALSHANEELLGQIKDILSKSPLKINQAIYLVPGSFTYELMHDSWTALAKSGTVTLELALHKRPSLIVYQLSRLNYWIAKSILRLQLPYYCIANILAGKEVFPESIGKTISPDALCIMLERIHTEEKLRNQIIKDCQKIEESLGISSANLEAAKAILELMKC
jgi:lipid-A-disaccharide synthase